MITIQLTSLSWFIFPHTDLTQIHKASLIDQFIMFSAIKINQDLILALYYLFAIIQSLIQNHFYCHLLLSIICQFLIYDLRVVYQFII